MQTPTPQEKKNKKETRAAFSIFLGLTVKKKKKCWRNQINTGANLSPWCVCVSAGLQSAAEIHNLSKAD